MRGFKVIILTVLMGMVFVNLCYCQDTGNNEVGGIESAQETKTAQGTVTSIDAAGGVITVNLFDAINLDNDNITVEILPQAEVYKEDALIHSSDIQVGDVVGIEYYNDSTGSLKATSVTVE
ncbi:MAG: hypothetical protein V1933_02770 [Candidatus Omnitrophota bacterium]